MSMHRIQLEEFEGPLDLLLELIEQEKLDVTSISLGEVAEQYVKILKQHRQLPVDTLAEFLVVASRLLLLKSRLLLPSLELTEEEEEDLASMTDQLAVYQVYRKRAQDLRAAFDNPLRLFPREGFAALHVTFAPPPGMQIDVFPGIFDRVVQSLPDILVLPRDVIRDVVSLEKKIENLRTRIHAEVEVSFATVVQDASSRVDVIVSFLALLELIKQQVVDVKQDARFGDIRIAQSS